MQLNEHTICRETAEMIIVTVRAVHVWVWTEGFVYKALSVFSRKCYGTSTQNSKHPEFDITLDNRYVHSLPTAAYLILHNKWRISTTPNVWLFH
jgi:hypothetical protein